MRNERELRGRLHVSIILYIVVNLHVLLDQLVTLYKINFAYWIRAVVAVIVYYGS